MKNLKTIAAVLLLSIVAAGCTKKADDAKGTIGLSLVGKTEARWVSDGNNLVEQLKKRGYATDLQYAQYEAPTQLSQIENLIAKGVKGLIVAPVDGTTMGDVLQQARAKGIKVISYDRLIRNSSDFDYYVTFDNRQTGVLQGRSLVEKLGLEQGKGPFTLEIFSGSTDDNNAHVVYEGMMSQLKPWLDKGKLVIRSGQVSLNQTATPNWDGSLAQSRMDNLLSAYYSGAHLDAVLAMNDNIATGVISSLKGVGYGTGSNAMPLITGQDAELPNVKAIIGGDQASTVMKDTRALALAAAEMMDAELSGTAVKVTDTTSYNNGAMAVRTQLLSPQLVDRSNWQKVLLEDTGYYTADQLK
jgi:putative multiple sugar transport system substrate-binding protein